MLPLLALLLTLTLSPDATQVALDGEGWIAAKPEETQTTWWWSPSCAPQKIIGAQPATCLATRALQVRATPSASVLWATEAMLRDLPDERLPRATVNAEGLAVIAAPAADDVWVRAVAEDTTSPWTRIAKSSSDLRLTPVPSVAMRITLATEDGKPLRRARVTVLPSDCERRCPERLLAFASGDKPVSLVGRRGAAYRLLIWSDSHAPFSGTISATNQAVTLRPGGTLAARLIDADKQPLRDARLEVVYRLPESKESIRRIAQASSDGSVSLSGLPVSLIEWTAAAPARSRRVDQAKLEAGASTDLGAIVLHPARKARVVVREAGGTAVAAAKVLARGVSVVSTDAGGNAVLSDLPPGDIPLEITADGFLPANATVRSDERETLVVTMSRGAGVRATLIRESDGGAPANARIRVTNNGRQSLGTVDLENGLLLSGLRAGTARLSIQAEGAQSHDTGLLQLLEGEVLDLGVITLAAGLEIRGTIVGEDAAPIGGARLRLLHTDGDSPSLAHVLGNWSDAESSADGTFRLTGLNPGTYLVVAAARDYADRVLPRVTVAENEPVFDAGTIALERGHTVELVCRPVKRCGTEASILPGGADYPFLAIRTTLQNGRGTFQTVPSGDVMLRLTRNQQVTHERNVNISGGSRSSTVEIELPAVRVHGEVVVGGRRARAGSLLFTRSARSAGIPILIAGETERGTTIDKEWLGAFGATATSDVGSNGEFALEDLEPGPYDVVFRSGDASSTTIRVGIPDVPDYRLPLEFAGAELAGRVIDAKDKPVAARVEAIDAAGASHLTSSGIDGEFRLLGLSSGLARVKATAGGRKGQAEVDTDDPSARSVVLRLADDPSAGVSVELRDDAGRPAAGILVFAFANGGVVAASTDRDGKVTLPNITGGAVPLAAHQPGGSWAFGNGQAGQSTRLVLPSRPGSLVANSTSPGEAAIIAPNGFPLERALPMVGISSRVTSGSSLRVSGLPPGFYDVSVGMNRRGVTIVAGAVAEVRFGE